MNRLRRKYAAVSGVCLALAMLTIGIIRDEPQEIFLKGIQICLACIGIG